MINVYTSARTPLVDIVLKIIKIRNRAATSLSIAAPEDGEFSELTMAGLP